MIQTIITILGALFGSFFGSKVQAAKIQNKQLKKNLIDLKDKHEIEAKNAKLDRRSLVDGL